MTNERPRNRRKHSVKEYVGLPVRLFLRAGVTCEGIIQEILLKDHQVVLSNGRDLLLS